MAYDYIERMYGSHFEKGQRVQFQEDGRLGQVLPVDRSHEHYVRVRFDNGTEGLCHPFALAILPHDPEDTTSMHDWRGSYGEPA